MHPKPPEAECRVCVCSKQQAGNGRTEMNRPHSLQMVQHYKLQDIRGGGPCFPLGDAEKTLKVSNFTCGPKIVLVCRQSELYSLVLES